MSRHCATIMNETHGILIGGDDFYQKTIIVRLEDDFEMIEGPPLTLGRYGHGCAKFSHQSNGTNYVIVAGPFDTVEILNVDEMKNGWFKGKNEKNACNCNCTNTS